MKMKTFNNVKSINFDVSFNGNGCVNWDSAKEQGWFLKNAGLLNGMVYNNVMYTKKMFKEIGDKILFKHKISSECLRHSIFSETQPCQNPLVMNIPTVFYSAIATQDAIGRGYMFASNIISPKKKSALTITDAVEDGPWRDKISVDVHTRSGMKSLSAGKDADEGSDTSLYYKENVGEATYVASGAIDLTELQFISNDPLYDRQAVYLDGGLNEKIYMESLERNMVNFKPRRAFYYIKSSFTQDEWAENGILLNRESVDAIVKRIINNILDVNVLKRDAYLRTKSLTVTVNYEGGSETFEVTKDNLPDFYFEYFQKYEEASEEKIKNNKKMSDDYIKAQTEAKKAKKASKKSKSVAVEEE